MVDQASMSRGNGSRVTSPVGMITNIADFGNDITTLAELQAKLTVHDAKECVSKASVPVAVLVVSAAMALGCLPVLLFGLADLLASAGKLSIGVSCLIVVAITMPLVGLVAYFAFRGLTSSLGSFRRSREELTRNLSWIRTVLVYSGRGVSRPQR